MTDPIGDLRRVTLIKSNGGYIFRQADKEKGAQGFPYLIVPRVDAGKFAADDYMSADRRGQRADAAGNGGADFDMLLAGVLLDDLKFGNKAALMNGGADSAGVGDDAIGRRDDTGRPQEFQNLRAAGRIAKADER